MRYCTKCVMPDTRPGIKFDENGVCSGCQSFERRKDIDWDARWKEFEATCDKYRGMNGSGYDCAIAVSGEKRFSLPGLSDEGSYAYESDPLQRGRQLPDDRGRQAQHPQYFRGIRLQYYQHEAGPESSEEAHAIYV